jgi:hypothetical protein
VIAKERSDCPPSCSADALIPILFTAGCRPDQVPLRTSWSDTVLNAPGPIAVSGPVMLSAMPLLTNV